MDTSSTLAQSMTADAISFDVLEKTYKPVLGLVKELLGVVPNCDMYLEVWPPAFRTYNLMVPAFLNLPALLFGKAAPKDIVGLGMYESSRAADCNYCSAHTCSFAMRRGASEDVVSGANRTPAEQAVVDMARALSTMPATYTPDLRLAVERHYGAVDTEWIGMGIVMMGFLNKFMDAMGIDLEPGAIADVRNVIETTGWEVGQHGWALADEGHGLRSATPPEDSFALYARVARLAPGAVRLERKWMKGIPSNQAGARSYIREEFGVDESLISRTAHRKPAMALAGMLAENLRPAQSSIGMAAKAKITERFAEVANSDHLRGHAAALASRHGHPPSDDPQIAAVMQLVESISPSPSQVDPTEVVDLRQELRSRQVIETVSWVSLLQLLHRLDLFQP